MKRYTTIIPSLVALACCLLLAACTSDTPVEPSDTGTPDARPLAITVSDGGHGSTAHTRAEERDYRTVFTEGDRIGLYVVRDGAVETSNLCLTLRGGKWTMPPGAAPLYYVPGRSYYAYYPYQDDTFMSQRPIKPGSEDFFQELVRTWDPKTRQDTYADYTASDLMTARGECTPDADGNYTLHFPMEHRMALVVFRLPATRYTYSETIDNIPIDKSYYRYTIVDVLMPENPSTGRYLINPQNSRAISFDYYSNGKQKEFSINSNSLNLQPGRYTICQVEGGAVTEEVRHLKEGDLYMKDGSVLPAEGADNMTAQDKENCLGVVFWVGENEGIHRTQTGWKRGDRLLMRDHPGCTHGIVVALQDASAGAMWATGSGANENLYNWANSFQGFNEEEQADWLAIYESPTSNHGYCVSHIVKLYGTYHPDATFPAYNTIGDYATRHPAPGSSSGWYFPSRSELAMMCYGMADDYGAGGSKERRDLLNGLIRKAGGDVLDGSYWSIWESGDYSWYFDFGGNTSYGVDPRSETHKVRAVLAF